MSETRLALDVSENHSYEIAVGHRYSNENTNDNNNNNTHLDAQSTDLTRRLLNNINDSKTQTRRTNISSNRHKWLCFNTDTWWIILFVICFFVFLTLLVGVICWTSSHIDPPFKLEVTSLQVASMTISNNRSSDIDNYMSADLNLTLSVTNQATELLIEHLLVSIKYCDVILSSTKIRPLYEEPEGHATIQLDMGFRAARLTHAMVDSLLNDLATNQTVEFTVIMQGSYGIITEILVDKHGVEIICEGVNVKFFPASNLTIGTMFDAPRSCKHTTVTW
ncbi:hypothetical protein RND81_03G045000 [Saponaria officinalis]|uniref:Late embryogenesis abundant protein LEA-2 subgroup domain-containing protein n=1 Tax=Saponaria officinalis TaxID=3572 RepID=A0AAW1M188_SAPOF